MSRTCGGKWKVESGKRPAPLPLSTFHLPLGGMALVLLTICGSLAASDAAPQHDFDRVAAAVQRDAPSQDLVDKLYAFMERYPRDPRSDRLQYWTGITQQRRRFHNEAIKELGFVLSDFPSSPLLLQALRAQAESYNAVGKPDKALENHRRIVALRPRDLTADPAATAIYRESLLVFIEQHIQKKELDAAIGLITQLPDRIEALTRTVNLYIASERHEEALNLVARLPPEQRLLGYRLSIAAHAARPGVANLWRLLEEILRKEKPEPPIDALVQQLAGAIGGRGAAEKQKVLDHLVQRYSRLARWARFELCGMHSRTDLQRLLDFIGRYIGEGPAADIEQAKTWVGQFHEAAGRPQQARDAYWRLDDKPAAHFLVAQTYYGPQAKVRDLPGGERELTEIVKRFYSPGTSAEALWRRAELQAGLMERTDAAIATLRELLDRFPAVGNYPVQSLMRLGQLYRQQRKQDLALECYERLILNYPNSPAVREAWLQVAGCHEEKGDQRKAIEVLRLVLRKFPRTGEASRAHTRLETVYKVPDTDVSDRN